MGEAMLLKRLTKLSPTWLLGDNPGFVVEAGEIKDVCCRKSLSKDTETRRLNTAETNIIGCFNFHLLKSRSVKRVPFLGLPIFHRTELRSRWISVKWMRAQPGGFREYPSYLFWKSTPPIPSIFLVPNGSHVGHADCLITMTMHNRIRRSEIIISEEGERVWDKLVSETRPLNHRKL